MQFSKISLHHWRQFENVEIKVGGELVDPENASINPGDSLEVSVNANDADNDKLGFLWGLASPDSSGNYEMKLLSEHNKRVSFVMPEISGTHFLNFIITDKKSYTGPVSIPFTVK